MFRRTVRRNMSENSSSSLSIAFELKKSHPTVDFGIKMGKEDSKIGCILN